MTAVAIVAFFSCEKAENNYVKDENGNQENFIEKTKKAPLVPPLRYFECGEPIAGSPYPCPNANCDYMGWDCLPTVYIFSDRQGCYNGNYEDYLQAVDILDYYIFINNTPFFFKNYVDELLLLMPDLGHPERYPILDDLKSGYTSVEKHPKRLASEEIINTYKIFVVETGESPLYK